MESSKIVRFRVVRKTPERITPAKPTPHEFKFLSDIDDQEGARYHIPIILFYRRNNSAERKDPVKVIRDAITKALVFYYPLAGRLREADAKKLVVECTGEGVLFIEADADVTLHQFGDTLQPPFPNLEELLYDVPGSSGVLHSPLLLIQVTRLLCGGFILAIRLNHTMCDATGLSQFLTAVSELARGAEAPSVLPIWDRHLPNARNPPHVTCTHREYDDIPDPVTTIATPPGDETVHRSFFFGGAELSALRSRLPPHLRGSTRFEIIIACIWRCRTIAISVDPPNQEVRILFVINARGKFSPPLPDGYYGNVLACPVAIATAGDLSSNPLHYAVELVRKAKAGVTEEYMKSMVDLLVTRGRPCVTLVGTHAVSDVTHAGLEQIDLGWGKPAYGGPAGGGVWNFFIPCTNNKGESEIMVPISLPSNAMKVFVKEIEKMLRPGNNDGKPIASAL